MFKVILHGLLARKFRLFATALAVTLGVAFMAGTMVLTDTIGHTFNDLSAGVYQGTDAEVRAKAAFSAPDPGLPSALPLLPVSLAYPIALPSSAATPGTRLSVSASEALTNGRCSPVNCGPLNTAVARTAASVPL